LDDFDVRTGVVDKAFKASRAASINTSDCAGSSAQGSSQSYGHLTMAHPALWADHVRDFMRWAESQGRDSTPQEASDKG
jgi:hypothetical protein